MGLTQRFSAAVTGAIQSLFKNIATHQPQDILDKSVKDFKHVRGLEKSKQQQASRNLRDLERQAKKNGMKPPLRRATLTPTRRVVSQPPTPAPTLRKVTNGHGFTWLTWAVHSYNENALKRWIDEFGTRGLDEPDANGNTAMEMAVKLNNIEAIKLLAPSLAGLEDEKLFIQAGVAGQEEALRIMLDAITKNPGWKQNDFYRLLSKISKCSASMADLANGYRRLDIPTSKNQAKEAVAAPKEIELEVTTSTELAVAETAEPASNGDATNGWQLTNGFSPEELKVGSEPGMWGAYRARKRGLTPQMA